MAPPPTQGRSLLVLGLAATAGSLDSWSYFGPAHVFVANMTGNTVVLGYSLGTGNWPHAKASALAIGSYLLGVFAASCFTGPIRASTASPQHEAHPAPAGSDSAAPPHSRTPGSPAAAFDRTNLLLACELSLVLASALLTALAPPNLQPHGNPHLHPHFEPYLRPLLLSLAAVAVGVQSATMLALELPGIVTTYITGTWTTMTATLAHLLQPVRSSDPAGKPPPVLWAQLRSQAALLFVYCSAAALSGALRRLSHPAHPAFAPDAWLPACTLTLVVIDALCRQPRSLREESS